MTDAMITPAARWPVRLQRTWAGIPSDFVLNAVEPDGPPSPDLAVDLRTALSGLVTSHSDSSGHVDYAGLAASTDFRDYRALAAGLRQFDPLALADEAARKAFWLNLYNALILHAVVMLRLGQHAPRGWFERAAYDVGGYRFSANDIEHGILRANQSHLLALGPQFRANDPRLRFRLAALDPRVHFALNCAARSCPPIRVYTPDRLDAQLDLATASFLHDGQLTVDRATMRSSACPGCSSSTGLISAADGWESGARGWSGLRRVLCPTRRSARSLTPKRTGWPFTSCPTIGRSTRMTLNDSPAPPDPAPPRSRRRRIGCWLAVIFWFALLLTPCALFYFAVQGETTIRTGGAPGQELRIWLVMEPRTRGFGISNGAVASQTDTALCVQTTTTYVLWAGRGQNAAYCECYERPDPGQPWAYLASTQGSCPAMP